MLNAIDSCVCSFCHWLGAPPGTGSPDVVGQGASFLPFQRCFSQNAVLGADESRQHRHICQRSVDVEWQCNLERSLHSRP